MTDFIGYIFLSLLFLIPVILYKKLYFKPITLILVTPEKICPVSLKPSRKAISEYLGGEVDICPLSNGYFAFYRVADVKGEIIYKDRFEFGTPVLIAARRRGRFCSIVISSRQVSDLISSFNFGG